MYHTALNIFKMHSTSISYFILLTSIFFLCIAQNPDTSPVISPNVYPFTASIQYRGGLERTGVILDASHVLTSAHRIDGIYYRDYRILVGQLNWTDNDEAVQQIRNVSQLFRHPESCYTEFDAIANNLVIFKLSAPLEFSENVQPIAFPALWSPTTGEGTIVGWKYNTTSLLHELQSVPLLDASTCRSFMGRYKYRTAHLCAGFLRPDGTSSDGKLFEFIDGSVLVCPEGDSVVACGILSYVPDPPVCQPSSGYPLIFTEVSKYSDWIQSVLDRPPPTTTTPSTVAPGTISV